MACAFVFPGQGSQSVGMGAALADQFPAGKAVFDEVDEALGQNLSAIMRDGPIEDLTLTANTQPALMAHSIAALRVLSSETDLGGKTPKFFAGHSLGEYSALCAAGAISLSDTAKLLRIRGEAMQAAVPVGKGAMAALIGVSLDGAENAVAAHKDAGVCEIANDNAPGQVVISGEKAAIDEICANAKAFGAKMAKQLPVSAPFHSSLMQPAAERMAAALAKVEIKSPVAPIYANITAAPTADPNEIRELLVKQVTGRVRWTESVQAMVDAGCGEFVEIGAGKVLCGLIRRIARDAKTLNFGEPTDLESFQNT
ncbi:MAG: ACP S-malonyltransferase [Marinicaulis sp.]|nr:ACP S-malonyltransferase [Marinicaulis sp.]